MSSTAVSAPMTAWTTALGARLLRSLPGDALAELASAHGAGKDGELSALPRVRRELLRRAGECEALQGRIRRAWRAAHGDVVAATQLMHLSVAGAASPCESLLGQFSPEDLLLELLTDEHDDGWQLAREFVQELRGDALRQQFEGLLAGWQTQGPLAKAARVVIFGGHPRDESRLAPLFEAGPFELRWRVCERRQGDSADRGLIADALDLSRRGDHHHRHGQPQHHGAGPRPGQIARPALAVRRKGHRGAAHRGPGGDVPGTRSVNPELEV